jgi:hypothetical protein
MNTIAYSANKLVVFFPPRTLLYCYVHNGDASTQDGLIGLRPCAGGSGLPVLLRPTLANQVSDLTGEALY